MIYHCPACGAELTQDEPDTLMWCPDCYATIRITPATHGDPPDYQHPED
jgi:predicted RNA-binding Zn-ribbon protein involved in translation (DUF1610 family)